MSMQHFVIQRQNELIPQLTLVKRAKPQLCLKRHYLDSVFFNTPRPVSKQPFMKTLALKQVAVFMESNSFLLEFH